jgi:hypothetical protein
MLQLPFCSRLTRQTVVRRVILLILLPALILTGLIYLNGEAANWHYVVPTDAQVLYAAGFDGFLDEWEQYEDGQLTARAEDGVFRLEIDAPQKIPYSAAAHHFSDFDASVAAQALAGPENNAYGLIFRLIDPDNNYQFLVSSDGFYGVVRRFKGEEKFLSAWIDSPIVNRGINAANDVRVVAQGGSFQFWVNGEAVQLCVPTEASAISTYSQGQCYGGTMENTLNDSAIPAGRLGVIARSFDEPGVIAQFDNLVVVSADAAAE